MRKNWRDDAACVGLGDDMYPESSDTKGIQYAQAVCDSCPIKADCLDDSMRREGGIGKDYRFGVRGGLTGPQRHYQYTKQQTEARRAAEAEAQPPANADTTKALV